MVCVPKNRRSTHAGEMLLEEFLIPMKMTQRELADSIHVPFQRVNEIVSGKRGLTPSNALRRAKFFGMSAGFWLNLQMRVDLETAESKERSVLNEIKPLQKSRIPKRMNGSTISALFLVRSRCSLLTKTFLRRVIINY